MNQKSIIAMLGVLVVILIGSTVYFAIINNASQPVVLAPKVAEQPAPTLTPVAQQPSQPSVSESQDIVYSNSAYGFSLNFPQSWKNFKVTDEKEGKEGTRITFSHPVAKCSFPILLSTIKEWDDCKLQKDPSVFYWCGKELGRNIKYVFHPADNAPDCENANLVKETSDIIKTFKITDSISQTVTDLKTVKGWLEGTRSPLELMIAETTATLSGYSGNKFALVFSKDSICTFAEAESSFSCTDSKVKWGIGDRVRVYGSIKSDKILVNKLEIVSALPIEKW